MSINERTTSSPSRAYWFGVVFGALSALMLCGASSFGALYGLPSFEPPPPTSPVFGPVIPLTFDLVDAEYSAALDRIVMVSRHPHQLHIFDPATQAAQIIELSLPPTAISLA